MIFDFAALDPCIIFLLSRCRIKGITYSYMNVLIRLVVMMQIADNYFFAQSSNIYTNMVWIALMMLMLGNPAAHNM